MPLDWLVNCLYANIFRFVGASVDRSAHQSPIVGVSNLWNFPGKIISFLLFFAFFCICCPSSCNWKVVLTIRIGWKLSLFCFFLLCFAFCPFWKRIFAFLLLFFAFFCFFLFFLRFFGFFFAFLLFFAFFCVFFFSFFSFVFVFLLFFAFFFLRFFAFLFGVGVVSLEFSLW